jgi:hypothetical protein
MTATLTGHDGVMLHRLRRRFHDWRQRRRADERYLAENEPPSRLDWKDWHRS